MIATRVALLGVFLLHFAAALNVQRAGMFDCPLCVAEERCHMACAEVKQTNPGSAYCLDACTGAHPDMTFDGVYFVAADKKIAYRQGLSDSIRKIGRELGANV